MQALFLLLTNMQKKKNEKQKRNGKYLRTPEIPYSKILIQILLLL